MVSEKRIYRRPAGPHVCDWRGDCQPPSDAEGGVPCEPTTLTVTLSREGLAPSHVHSHAHECTRGELTASIDTPIEETSPDEFGPLRCFRSCQSPTPSVLRVVQDVCLGARSWESSREQSGSNCMADIEIIHSRGTWFVTASTSPHHERVQFSRGSSHDRLAQFAENDCNFGDSTVSVESSQGGTTRHSIGV